MSSVFMHYVSACDGTEHLVLIMASPPQYNVEETFINEDGITINEEGIYGGHTDGYVFNEDGAIINKDGIAINEDGIYGGRTDIQRRL